MRISKLQKEVILDSVKLEAREYFKYITNQETLELNEAGIEFSNKVANKIIWNLQRKPAKTLYISHYSRLGLISGQEIIEMNSGKENIYVDYCNCGKLKHWGKVFYETENPYKENDSFRPLYL